MNSSLLEDNDGKKEVQPSSPFHAVAFEMGVSRQKSLLNFGRSSGSLSGSGGGERRVPGPALVPVPVF